MEHFNYMHLYCGQLVIFLDIQCCLGGKLRGSMHVHVATMRLEVSIFMVVKRCVT